MDPLSPMTPFLIWSQILVFLHIVFGEIAGATLLWTVKELLFLGENRLKWVTKSLWIAFGSVMLAWIFGGSYYLFFYPQVKEVIKKGPENFAHLIFTESKEHIFLLIPVIIFFACIYAQKRQQLLLSNHSARKKFLFLVILAALLIFSMAFMGYMITWGARTALWIKNS